MAVKFLGDRLAPNHSLHPNEGIKSKNGRVQVILQPDGNCVLYGDKQPLWWTGVRPGVNSALMQTDGNFVLYKPGEGAVWNSGTAGNPGAFLLAQDDGNLVVYAGSRALWNSNTNGFRYYGGPKELFSPGAVITNLVKGAAQTAVNTTGIPITVVSIGEIPVLGDVVNIVGEAAAAPFHFAAAIASGERLDQALVDQFNEQLKILKDIAPYAQTIVSFVPGLGTGVSMALGAGIALANGQSITDAAKAAIRGAIPGGALVQTGFDLALKVASGENIGKAALETARAQLPANAQKAFDIGLAVVTGEKIQTALAKGLASFAPGQLQTILAAGEKALASTPGLADALKLLPVGEATQGFQLAAGLLSHTGINEKALLAARSQLPPEVVRGFDAALKTQEGRLAWVKNVTSAPAPAAVRAAVAPTRALRALDPPKKLAPAPAQAPLRALDPPKKAAVPAQAPLRALDPPKRPGAPAAPTSAAPAAQAGRDHRRFGAYAPYPRMGALSDPPRYAAYPGGSLADDALSAPPHPPHPPHHGGGGRHMGPDFQRPIFRGGRGAPGWWWDVPWSPEVITRTETCRTWGDPIEMPVAMVQAARMALGASKGRPSAVRGPDNVLYLFAFENGEMTARPCTAVATA